MARTAEAGCEYRLVDMVGRQRTVTLAVSPEPNGLLTGLVVDVSGTRGRAVAEAVDQQLAHALESRAVIDQAKGVVVSIFGVDSATAFSALALISQHRNVRVRLLAEQIRTAAEHGGLDVALRAVIQSGLDAVSERTARAEQGEPAPSSCRLRRSAGGRAGLGSQGLPLDGRLGTCPTRRATSEPLAEYRAKRDPARTPEPVPPPGTPAGVGGGPDASSSRSTTPARCTGTSVWSATASWCPGPSPRGSRRTRRPTTSPCTPRTTRWSTRRSRARSARASTAAARSPSGTTARTTW